MADQRDCHWTSLDCTDQRRGHRYFRLAQSSHGVRILSPAAEVTLWSLEQATALRDELDKTIAAAIQSTRPPE